MKHNILDILEAKDEIDKLKSAGYGSEIAAIPDCYTRNGRLKFSELGRKLKIPTWRVKGIIEEMREILGCG